MQIEHAKKPLAFKLLGLLLVKSGTIPTGESNCEDHGRCRSGKYEKLVPFFALLGRSSFRVVC